MIVTQRGARNVLWVMLGFALGVFVMIAVMQMFDAYRRSYAIHQRGQAMWIATALHDARARRGDTSFRSGEARAFQSEIDTAFGHHYSVENELGPTWIIMDGARVTVIAQGMCGFAVISDGPRAAPATR